jgi:hypothetical protein
MVRKVASYHLGQLLAAAPTPVISGGLKTVIVTVMRREIARFSDCRHQASGMWSLAL